MGILFPYYRYELNINLHVWQVYKLGIYNARILWLAGSAYWRSVQYCCNGYLLYNGKMAVSLFYVQEENLPSGIKFTNVSNLIFKQLIHSCRLVIIISKKKYIFGA